MQKAYFLNEIYGLLVWKLAEKAQLLLLKAKLNKIRKSKRKMQFLSYAIGVIVTIILYYGLQNWETEFTTYLWSLLIGGIVGVSGWLTVNRHYNAREEQVILQIKQLTKENTRQQDNK